jgi:transcriptional regulator with XRE-family HTH domain
VQGHLWQIIQKHLDDYGVREAEFARRIGTSPQTVSSWKKRGVRSLPAKRLLVGVSDVTRRPYDEVLTAALYDAKYLPKEDASDGSPITDHEKATEVLRRLAREATPERPRAPARPGPRKIVGTPDLQ